MLRADKNPKVKKKGSVTKVQVMIARILSRLTTGRGKFSCLWSKHFISHYGRSELVISTHEGRLIRSESHREDSAATGLIWPWLFFWITRLSKLQHWQEILFLPSILSLTHWVLPGRMCLAPTSFSLTKLIPTQISFIYWQQFSWPATSPNKDRTACIFPP